jgi:hypothetical protein
MSTSSFFINKIESLRMRAKALNNLQADVVFTPERDLKKEQWDALNAQLSSIANGLLQKLRTCTDRFLSDTENPAIKKQLVLQLGNLEWEITRSYTFYDTYMDLLTQRLSKPIGELLKGCDVIAMDGISRGFLADITLPPIVYCDRGFGASTGREGINIADGIPNPIQFIAIPYARLLEKYNLISVYHEIGHQALIKLNMVALLQKVFDEQLTKIGASQLMKTLFVNWTKELGPDFWAFCLTGMAHTCSLRDVLFLPHNQVTFVSTAQQHPPAYIRFLASVHWCRHIWGKGDWDDWEKEWKETYPVHATDSITQEVLQTAERLLPLSAKIFCETKFKKFDSKPITSLFSINTLSPVTLKKLALNQVTASSAFNKLPIGVQLATFRLMRENRKHKLPCLDKLMTTWLKTIAN